MRISDWSSDVCSSDLARQLLEGHAGTDGLGARAENLHVAVVEQHQPVLAVEQSDGRGEMLDGLQQQILRLEGHAPGAVLVGKVAPGAAVRSEEHTSELQSLMRISYAVFCLKKQKAIICTHFTVGD